MNTQKKMTVQPNLLKALNKTAIKRVLLHNTVATRVEISAMTGISQPTVNAIMSELVADHEVIEKGLAGSQGGRKAAVYELNQEYAHAVILMIRQSQLWYRVIDLASENCEEQVRPVLDGQDLLQTIVEVVTGMQTRYQNVQALVIGVPGSVDREGTVYAIPDIPEFEEFPLGKKLSSMLTIPVKIMNDMKATALGCVSRNRPESSNMVYLHVGNGLGAGLITDSQLLSGVSGFAGEIGFMQLGMDEYMLNRTFKGLLDQTGYDQVTRITANIISMLNPSLVVIGGNCAEKKLGNYIEADCKTRFPKKMIPQIEICEDAEKYYIRGLSRTAMELCSSDVRLA